MITNRKHCPSRIQIQNVFALQRDREREGVIALHNLIDKLDGRDKVGGRVLRGREGERVRGAREGEKAKGSSRGERGHTSGSERRGMVRESGVGGRAVGDPHLFCRSRPGGAFAARPRSARSEAPALRTRAGARPAARRRPACASAGPRTSAGRRGSSKRTTTARRCRRWRPAAGAPPPSCPASVRPRRRTKPCCTRGSRRYKTPSSVRPRPPASLPARPQRRTLAPLKRTHG